MTTSLKSVKLCLLRRSERLVDNLKPESLQQGQGFGRGIIMGKSRKASFTRGQSGEFLIDGSLCIVMLLGVVMLPCADLATMGLRHVFLSAAARNAVHVASKAKTFEVSLKKPSAKAIAEQVAKSTAEGFSGIEVQKVETAILATNLETQQTTRYIGPLPKPADTSTHVYNIETVIEAKIYPLFLLNKDILGTIPGMTVPMEGKASAQEYSEHTQGLNF